MCGFPYLCEVEVRVIRQIFRGVNAEENHERDVDADVADGHNAFRTAFLVLLDAASRCALAGPAATVVHCSTAVDHPHRGWLTAVLLRPTVQ